MTVDAAVPAARGYRVTALGSALLVMWGAWRVLVPVILVNAAVQSLLVLSGVLPYVTWLFVGMAVVGYLVMVASYGLVAAAVVQVVRGSVSWRSVLGSARPQWWRLLAWSFVLLLAVLIGLSLYVVPGILVLALTPYVLLAVVDGRGHPWRVNARTIRVRAARWAVTVIAMIVICAGLWLLSALDGFFLTGAPAALVGWVVLGFVAAWFLCAWALIYRSADVRD